jgi:hypothetical protein
VRWQEWVQWREVERVDQERRKVQKRDRVEVVERWLHV